MWKTTISSHFQKKIDVNILINVTTPNENNTCGIFVTDKIVLPKLLLEVENFIKVGQRRVRYLPNLG